MRRTFVELPQFERFIDSYEYQGLLELIQEEILMNPDRGDVIPNTGGLRKDRCKDLSRGKGKRAGIRYLFLDLPDTEKTYLIALYSKGTKIDISPDERKIIRSLVKALKQEAKK